MSNLPAGQQRNEQPANDAGYAALMAIKPGERLREARKARKLDLEAAAAQMNLSVSVIRALESDDYAALPSSTFVKGYIRSYGRLLRLPADELVRAYEHQTGVHSSMDEQHPVPERAARKGFRKGWLLLLILLIVGGMFLRFSPEKAAREEAPPSADGVNEEVTSGGIVGSAESLEPSAGSFSDQDMVMEIAASYDEPEQEGAEGAAPEGVELMMPVAAPALEQAALGSAAQAAGNEAQESSDSSPRQAEPQPSQAEGIQGASGVLGMRFSDDCWVEIRNQRGKLVHADLHRAGTAYEKALQEPFEVKLGNGNAVQLSYNGDPVAFAPSSRTSVARLNFGE